MDRMGVLYRTKDFIEKHLAETHNLQMAQLPLILSKIGGVNDLLTCDGSGTPVEFPAGPGLEKRIETQGVQDATQWIRMAVKQFDCASGERD